MSFEIIPSAEGRDYPLQGLVVVQFVELNHQGHEVSRRKTIEIEAFVILRVIGG
jgi:hypothetical protein